MRWTSILHHIRGIHRWEDEHGVVQTCLHEPLDEDEQRLKMWLDEDSTAYRELSKYVTSPALLKDLRQMTLFKHTSKFSFESDLYPSDYLIFFISLVQFFCLF